MTFFSFVEGVIIGSGNLSFSASMANGTIAIGCNNALSPTTSNVVMKYVVRRWKSQ